MKGEARDHYLARLGRIEIERSSLREQIQVSSDQLQDLDREADMLRRLISSEGSDRRYGPRGGQWLEAAYLLLRNEGRPLHYRELLDRLRDEGYEIGGSATEANLVTRLNRDSRFRRVGRGVYAVDGLQMENSTSRDMIVPVPRESGIHLLDRKERERARLRQLRESVGVEIEVVRAAIHQLRTDAQRGKIGESGQDPFAAIPVLEKRLMRLLEQRQSLDHEQKAIESELHRLADARTAAGEESGRV